MYEAFFNLKSKPFSLLPDPEFLFLSSRHAIGLSLLEYSLSGQAGFCVITGEIGSGKTTLVRAFLARVGKEFTVGLISNTHSAFRDAASWALTAFGQRPSSTNQAETYQELMGYLIAEYGAGRQCILIVDEAQNLSIEVLEELRLLSNINSGKDLLLQMVLVGQPELLAKLKRPELSQFAQRIAVSHHLTPLPYAETRRYIEHRLKVAGCDRPLFTEMAMGAVQYFSGGVPRLINSICDMALVYGFADAEPVINEDLVFRVVADRQVSGIAPFARSESANDPMVREEIEKLTGARAAVNGNAAGHEAATLAPTTEIAGVPHSVAVAPLHEDPVMAPRPDEPQLPPVAIQPTPVARAPIGRPQPVPKPQRAERSRPIERAPQVERPQPVEPQRPSVAIRLTPIEPTEQVEEPQPSERVVQVERPQPVERLRQVEPVQQDEGHQENDDEEDLLLTVEVTDELDATEATPNPDSDASNGRSEPYLGKPPTAEIARPLRVASEDQPAALVARQQLGTETTPRRSWWRRSFARGN